jgi:soluble lytic murein transglycosylase
MRSRRRDLLAVLGLLPAAAASRPPAPAAAQGGGGSAAVAQGGGGSAAAGRQALALAQAGRWAEAEAAARGADPAVAKVVAWMRLTARGSGATAPEIVAFGLANPDWPAPEALARRAEEALAADPDDALAVQWFAARAPRTLDGYQRLADALARAGRGDQAAEVLREGWARAPGDAIAEGNYAARNAGGVLTAEDHWRRFDRTALLREGAPGRLVPLLDPRRQAFAAARLAYAADAPDADAPPQNAAAARGDLGLTLERARWLRRRESDAEAAAAWAAGAALQRDLPPEIARAVWTERQVLSRKLLRLGQPQLAYGVAAQHGQEAPGEPRQDAEFLAGFIALRLLGDPAAAERHFVRLMADSRSVITRARGLYWQGRAAQAQGATARARERYVAAMEFPLAFYGQLAAVTLGEDGAALSGRILRAPSPEPNQAQLRALEGHELTAVVLALSAIGEGRRARPFLLRLEELAADPAEKLLVARLAERTGRPDNPVWVARRAGAAGLMALAEGWPAPYATPSDMLEPALVNAISRQESNFDPEAVSSANARGLMQLLPATAATVARRLGVRHQPGMLTADPTHNMRLGAAYLSELIGRFDGALPLAVAGYNAGPARVAEWTGTYGDPRYGGGGGIAMLDWMELIPFAETRNYVQRVLENLAIYRAREGGGGGGAAMLEHPMTRWLGRDA